MKEQMKNENKNKPTMEPTKILIENWPKDPWIKTWMPVIISTFIALIALGVSLLSVHYTKKEFIRNSRPYVWAINFFDLENKINRPDCIVFRVSNSPAKIKMVKMEIYAIESNSKELLYESNPEGGYSRYPDGEKANWSLRMPPERWADILTNYSSNQTLQRHIIIEYSSLDGNQIYDYKIIQRYTKEGNDWLDIDVQAD